MLQFQLIRELSVMTKANKKMISMLKELHKATDHAACLISQITGEDITVIKSKSADEIFQYLSYLLAKERKEEKELNWRNDKTSSPDLSPDSHSYELIAKGVLNSKYKHFGTTKNVHEFLKFFASKLGDLALLRVYSNNQASSNLSNPYATLGQTTQTPLTKLSIPSLRDLLAKFQLGRVSNDNTGIGFTR
jgi:hypothetical protein